MDIFSILSNAGLSKNPKKIDISISFEDSICDDEIFDIEPVTDIEATEYGFLSPLSNIEEGNAEYDISKKITKPKGVNGEIDAYKTLGQANLDTRYVPAKSGDNPLTGEFGISPIKEKKTFKDFLNKGK